MQNPCQIYSLGEKLTLDLDLWMNNEYLSAWHYLLPPCDPRWSSLFRNRRFPPGSWSELAVLVLGALFARSAQCVTCQAIIALETIRLKGICGSEETGQCWLMRIGRTISGLFIIDVNLKFIAFINIIFHKRYCYFVFANLYQKITQVLSGKSPVSLVLPPFSIKMSPNDQLPISFDSCSSCRPSNCVTVCNMCALHCCAIDLPVVGLWLQHH